MFFVVELPVASAVPLEEAHILGDTAPGGSTLAAAGLGPREAAAGSSRGLDACIEAPAHTDQAADGSVGRARVLDNLAPREDRDVAEEAAGNCLAVVDQVEEAEADSHSSY